MATSKSTRPPAFQYYPKDFLTDANVLAMSLTERGAYWTLISVCWLEGTLPVATKALARLLGITDAHMGRLWPALAPCFRVKGDRLSHPRLDRELQKQRDHRDKQAANGAKGGRPKKAVGSFGETQTEAKESSSSPIFISNLQSPSAKKNTDRARETAVDVQAQVLLSLYPPQGACSIHAVTAALRDVLHGAPGDSFDALLERLESHKRSAKWAEQGGRFIPRLDRYLTSGTHLQLMPSAEAVERESANAKLPAWARS